MAGNRFEQKVCVVTGGASGIGEAMVRLLLAEGAQIVIGDINETKAGQLVRELGDHRLKFVACDVSRQSDVTRLIDIAFSEFGALNVLCNNAGVSGAHGKSPAVDPQAWDQTIAINLNSVFYSCRAAIPLMRRGGGGAIVNTASISGLYGHSGFPAYCASKAAVINYTRVLALDHGRDNIRVNAICPGLIDTPLTSELDQIPDLRRRFNEAIPLGGAGGPDEIAKVAAFLASDDASYITGSIIIADGGLTAATAQPKTPLEMAEDA